MKILIPSNLMEFEINRVLIALFSLLSNG